MPSSPHNSVVLETKAHLGPNLGLGSASPQVVMGMQLENNVEDVTQSKSEKLEERNIATTSGPSKGLDIEVTMPCNNVGFLAKTFKNQK